MAVRLRFSSYDDLCLLKEVASVNPFINPEDWKLVHENVLRTSNKNFSIRAIKDHTDHLINVFERNDKTNLKKSGTEEEYNEKQQLLQEILDLKREKNVAASQTSRNQQKKGAEIRQIAAASLVIEEEEEEPSQTPFENTEDHLDLDVSVNPLLNNILEVDDNDVASGEQAEDDANIIHVVKEDTPPRVLGPKRQKKTRAALKNSTLQFIANRRDSEAKLKERELALEERKLRLEEAKLNLQKEEFEFRRSQEREDLEYRRKQSDQNQNLIDMLLNQIFKKD